MLKTCLSNDKKYFAISNNKGRLFIYNTKDFKREKIKKFENYHCFNIPSYSNFDEELKKLNTIRICKIFAFKNFFLLKIEYAFTENKNLKYKGGLIPLKKEGNIWEFKNFINVSFSLNNSYFEINNDKIYYNK